MTIVENPGVVEKRPEVASRHIFLQEVNGRLYTAFGCDIHTMAR